MATAEVELVGWRRGMKKVTVDRLLATQGGIGLAAGKAAVDHLLAGRHVVVRVPSRESAEALVAALNAAGVDANVCPSKAQPNER